MPQIEKSASICLQFVSFHNAALDFNGSDKQTHEEIRIPEQRGTGIAFSEIVPELSLIHISLEEVADITRENGLRFYGING